MKVFRGNGWWQHDGHITWMKAFWKTFAQGWQTQRCRPQSLSPSNARRRKTRRGRILFQKWQGLHFCIHKLGQRCWFGVMLGHYSHTLLPHHLFSLHLLIKSEKDQDSGGSQCLNTSSSFLSVSSPILQTIFDSEQLWQCGIHISRWEDLKRGRVKATICPWRRERPFPELQQLIS